jgi:hypothetical protein
MASEASLILPEDLDQPVPGADECLACGAPVWECRCVPGSQRKPPTATELERARQERLNRAEQGERRGL